MTLALPGAVASWEILPPAGLTQTGRIRQFQNRTVERLEQRSEQLARDALAELKAEVAATYKEGSGTVGRTLQYRVTASRDGVQVDFLAGGRELVFLTGLAGEPFRSEGHVIPLGGGHRGRYLRFFWKNPPGGDPPGVYRMQEVHWRTRQGRDVIAEVLRDHAVRFEQEMVRTHETALIQFVQENAQPATRSPRVSAFRENQIGPRY